MKPGAAEDFGRRRFVTLLSGLVGAPLAVSAAGCGFRPVYGDYGAASEPWARQGLAAIDVAIIPERSGQLFRQALQERCGRFGNGVEIRYALRASFSVSQDAIGVEPDSTVTRIRVTGYSQYGLHSLDAAARTVTSGSARAVDGYDTVNQQFFAADLESEQVIRRVAEAVADQVTLQLANFFDAHGLA